MYEYIQGKLDITTPTYAVVDCQGVGYQLHISLHTYSRINGQPEVKLWCHHVVREDAQLLYGFAEVHERELFRQLISVSGVGAATARMILSSLNPAEVEKAIVGGDVNTLKRIKGIGAKSAERIIVDLKDKLGKGSHIAGSMIPLAGGQSYEAGLALQALGFQKAAIDKALLKAVDSEGDDAKVETLIKTALKYL